MNKSLICITTANRASAVKALVWPYLEYCKKNIDFDFLISVDGEDKETITFCNKYKIPVLYSEKREGVGLSKNRVFSAYPDYQYYFFLEDDVGLLDESVFLKHINVSRELDLHHMSLFESNRIVGVAGYTQTCEGRLIHADYGSAQFNFFTKKGIDIVGGFHSYFAKFKRYGHTEHTYRYLTNGLTKSAFCVLEDCLNGYLRWSDPISVSNIKNEMTENRLFVEEQSLIDKKIKFEPVKTISSFTKPDSLDSDYLFPGIRRYFYHVKYWGGIFFLEALRKAKRIIIR